MTTGSTVPNHPPVRLVKFPLADQPARSKAGVTALQADTIKIVRRADENLALRNGRRRLDLLAKWILREHLEFRPGLDDSRFAVVADAIDASLHANRRGRKIPTHA